MQTQYSVRDLEIMESPVVSLRSQSMRGVNVKADDLNDTLQHSLLNYPLLPKTNAGLFLTIFVSESCLEVNC